MKIEKIVDGLSKYIEDKMFPTMVNWQRIAARTVIARAKKKPEIIGKIMPALNFLEYADESQDINIDDFIEDFNGAVRAEGFLELSIPFLGLKYKFLPSDVDELCRYLRNS